MEYTPPNILEPPSARDRREMELHPPCLRRPMTVKGVTLTPEHQRLIWASMRAEKMFKQIRVQGWINRLDPLFSTADRTFADRAADRLLQKLRKDSWIAYTNQTWFVVQ